MGEVMGGVDQCHVAKRLGKVTHQAFSLNVVFFAEQTHIVSEAKQFLEQGFGIGLATQ
jgi:hypothetical protein